MDHPEFILCSFMENSIIQKKCFKLEMVFMKHYAPYRLLITQESSKF